MKPYLLTEEMVSLLNQNNHYPSSISETRDISEFNHGDIIYLTEKDQDGDGELGELYMCYDWYIEVRAIKLINDNDSVDIIISEGARGTLLCSIKTLEPLWNAIKERQTPVKKLNIEIE